MIDGTATVVEYEYDGPNRRIIRKLPAVAGGQLQSLSSFVLQHGQAFEVRFTWPWWPILVDVGSLGTEN